MLIARSPDSPIVRLNLLGQNVLVCNTLQTVLDLLDKRSAIYSDRCRPFPEINEHFLTDVLQAVSHDEPRAVRIHFTLLSNTLANFNHVRCGWYWATTGIPYGKEWRTHRRLFHAQFHSQTVKQWRPIETKATHKFLRRLLDTPGDFMHHIRQSVHATFSTLILIDEPSHPSALLVTRR